MNREEANKIIVDDNTIVCCDERGEDIPARELQKWAYRRLETWPKMLEALETFEQTYGPDRTYQEMRYVMIKVNAAIRKARGG